MKQPVNCKIPKRHWTKTSQWFHQYSNCCVAPVIDKPNAPAESVWSLHMWLTVCIYRSTSLLSYSEKLISEVTELWSTTHYVCRVFVWMTAFRHLCIYLCFQWSNFSTSNDKVNSKNGPNLAYRVGNGNSHTHKTPNFTYRYYFIWL